MDLVMLEPGNTYVAYASDESARLALHVESGGRAACPRCGAALARTPPVRGHTALKCEACLRAWIVDHAQLESKAPAWGPSRA